MDDIPVSIGFYGNPASLVTAANDSRAALAGIGTAATETEGQLGTLSSTITAAGNSARTASVSFGSYTGAVREHAAATDVLVASQGKVSQANEEIVSSSGRASAAHRAQSAEMGDLEKSARGAAGGLTGLSKAMMFGSNAFITGAIGGMLVKNVVDTFDAAQAAQTRLAQAVRDSGGSWADEKTQIDSSVESLSKLSAFTTTDLTGSLTSLITLTGNVSQSMSDLTLATDLARAKNMDLQTAVRDVTLVQEGRSSTLRRQGIVLPQVTTAEDALKTQLAALTGENEKATEASKLHAEQLAKEQDAAASASIDMQKLTEMVQGQDAAFVKTSAGGIAEFHNNLNQLEISLGTVLVPDIDQVVVHLNAWLSNSNNLKSAQQDLKDVLDAVSVAVHGIGDLIHTADQFTGGLKNTIELLLALKVVSTFAGWTTELQAFTGAGGLLGAETGATGLLRVLEKLIAVGASPIKIAVLMSYSAELPGIGDALSILQGKDPFAATGANSPNALIAQLAHLVQSGTPAQRALIGGGGNTATGLYKLYEGYAGYDDLGNSTKKTVSADQLAAAIQKFAQQHPSLFPGFLTSGAQHGLGMTGGGATPNTTGASSLSAGRQRMLELAKAAIGTPYVWGGEGSGGMDCSGLVAWALQNGLNVDIGRTTGQMFGQSPFTSKPRPGDLVFTNFQGGTPEHMGIYAGNGMVIASEGAGPSDTAAHPGPGVKELPLSAFEVGGRVVYQTLPGQKSGNTIPNPVTGSGELNFGLQTTSTLHPAMASGASIASTVAKAKQDLANLGTLGKEGELFPGLDKALDPSISAWRKQLDGFISDVSSGKITSKALASVREQMSQVGAEISSGLNKVKLSQDMDKVSAAIGKDMTAAAASPSVANQFAGQIQKWKNELASWKAEIDSKGIIGPDEVTRVKTSMGQIETAVKTGLSNIKTAISEQKQAFKTAFSDLAQQALQAFDQETANWVAPAAQQLADLEAQATVIADQRAVDSAQEALEKAKLGTPDTSSALAAIQQTLGQANLAYGIGKAQAGVLGQSGFNDQGLAGLLQQLTGEANPKNVVDPEAVTSAEQQLQDAQLRQQEDGLQRQADQQKKSYDDQRANERTTLSQSMSNWETYYTNLGSTANQAMGELAQNLSIFFTGLGLPVPDWVSGLTSFKMNPIVGAGSGAGSGTTADAFGRYLQNAQSGVIPSFDTGGIVPGAVGKPTLAIVHGGETVVPAGARSSAGAGGPIIIELHGDLSLADKVVPIVRSQTGAIAVEIGRMADRRRRANQF